MITKKDLISFDKSNIHQVYDRWPEIARQAYESDHKQVSYDKIDHIVFAGMGGSGAVGDLFASVLSKSSVHVSTVKGYLLPKTVDKNTLVVVTSVSGNTSESFTVLKSASKLDCNVIAFSSGGKIEEYCQTNQIEFRKISMTHSPRTSFVNFVFSILKILNSALPIEKSGILESINELDKIHKEISSKNLSDTNPAIYLASWISNIPLIYYPHGLQSAATRFKSSLQENAKIHAMTEDIIEACHNGIMSWENNDSIVQPILLRGQDDYIKTKERFDIVKEYFTKNNIDFQEVFSVSGNILSKLVTLVYLLDYTSIYKAIINKIDPTPVDSINFIKKRL